MKRKYTATLLLLFLINLSYCQQNSYNLKILAGSGFADSTSFFANNLSLGVEFQKNRVEFNIQSGSKKRVEYSNGDFPDALMTNYTFTYARLFSKNRFSFIPKLGAGYVSGRWETTYKMDNSQFIPLLVPRSKLLTGFGLNYGIGCEYALLNYLSINLSYNEALLLSDLSGNRSILAGLVFKYSKKKKEPESINPQN